MHRIFGIRHHGPGSASRLKRALDLWQPDCVLVEAPADAQQELKRANLPGLEPPIALVLYNELDLRDALYLPFARFSPEWQAIQWALHQGVTLKAIDLPAQQFLAYQTQASQLNLTNKDQPASAADTEIFIQDPLSVLAQLAGYDEVEPWWDATFEQESDDLEVFSATLELMAKLRQANAIYEKPETLLREAYMRQELRKAYKEGHKRIAVVCGAWHAPALDAVMAVAVASDRQRLKEAGSGKVKIKAAWIPWSYPRLATNSGYGAGVISPAWYDLRFDYGHRATIYWMTRASQLLRASGIDNSPAHATEAVRLANTLAGLRDLSAPNLTELRAAALSVLCEGAPESLALIEGQLVMGDKVGQVPPSAAVVPLQQELNQSLKSLRLQAYWGKTEVLWLKATASNPRGGIDLREDNDLQKSRLLHRLRVLDIPWGEPQEASAQDLGSFKEIWRLHWQPEYSLRVIEAAMWGNTLTAAATAVLQHQATEAHALSDLVALVQTALLAGLPDASPALVQQLQQRAALTRDLSYLLPCLPGLVHTIQYGDARKTDVTALAILVQEITPRIALGLAAAAQQLDEDAARVLLRDLMAADRALHTLNLPELNDLWQQALGQVAVQTAAHALVRGVATRLLFDRQRIDVQTAAQHLSFALSQANKSLDTAYWLEGFLPGSGLLLLYHPPLWHLIDGWVSNLEDDIFPEILPILRRTFSRFSAAERQKILEQARQYSLAPPEGASDESPDQAAIGPYDASRQHKIIPGLLAWIGGD